MSGVFACRLAAAAAVVFLAVASGAVQAAQQCTVQRVGNDEYRGISGTSDSNVIAVAKKGSIYRYDGTSWVQEASGSNKDLNDVEAVGDTAFAVGNDGETLQYAGGIWISHTGFTSEDLFGVWAAASGEAWIAGQNGKIFYFDGTSWSDQSATAGTIPDDLTDVWGDASAVWVVSEKGDLYRYDRATGSWDARDASCTAGDKFEDLWGDASGNIYLAARKDIFVHDGSSCSVAATASEDLFGISGWTQDGSVIAVGKKGIVFEYDGSAWTETRAGNKQHNDVWVSPAGNAYFAGKNKELTTCTCTDCPVIGLAQFVITHDSWGINCLSEVLQVDVIDATSGTPRTDYDAEVTLDTQSGFGTWTLVAGGGGFADAVANDGFATYDWPLGESTATFALSYPEGPASIDADIYQTSDTGIRDNDAEGALTFSPSGFTLTEAALSNPPPAVIAPFSMPQIAGTDFAVHIAAYGQTPTDPVCGIIEAYAGAKNLKFWFGYNDPVAGTLNPTIDGLGVSAAEAAAAPQPVAFVNGQAVVTAKYKDVGRIQISVKDDSQAHPDLPNGIRGATAAFVVKPAGFVLTSIEDGAGNPNPGAADANGPAFVAAGEPFAATVTAYDAEGSVTPNYGQEIVPETVALTPALIAPAAGDNPAIAAPLGFAAFAAGQATGTDFSWPEVGIISLTPSVGDGDYLGAGDVLGTTTGNVGRFFAHHFSTAVNVPTLATGCAAGSFTYIGDAFGYANVPVVTFTAEAAGGELTENYTGGFFKVDNASLPDRVYTAVPATLDTSGLPAPAVDPAVADLGAGVGTLTFSSGGGLSFTRGPEEPTFTADIRLSQSLIDSDGAAASVNPIVFGDPGGILWTAGAEQRYGRAVVLNAYGSELVDLAVPFRTEYYVDAATGFVPNVDDACTNAVSLSLGAFTENLSPGDTCVYDTGAPGASGEGCAAAGPPALRWREPPLGGDFNLHLRAPNAGNDGSTTATADVPAWLEYDWDQTLPGLEDPSGTAVFGIYKGSERRIYIREVY